ncbi:hypothetical protein [Bradyrhizobium sp.]|uniref:hypothetical protein n=1 Tax=Bradyrhizobium sp. TaxID=376 RepID=UPI00403794E0
MNNRVNEIRKMIKALRVSMMEAEAAMRDQINHDRDCTFVAQDLLNMRAVMAGLVREKESLGDHDPIVVNCHFTPRTARKPFSVVKQSSVQALNVG